MLNISNHWYITSLDSQVKGPITEKELIRSLQDEKISWTIFACNPAIDLPWTRLYDVKNFQDLLPPAPTLNLYKEISYTHIQRWPKTVKDPWYIRHKGSQLGPLTFDEVQILIRQPKFSEKIIYVWKTGLIGWTPIEEVPELSDLHTNSQSKRKSERVNLLADVYVQSDDIQVDDFHGICRDISISGIFISTHVEMKLLAPVRLKIQPVSHTELPTLELEGHVIANQRDDEGFAVEFSILSEKDEQSLQLYIANLKTDH